MGALMRQMDWSATRVGPVEGWPGSLRVATGILLGSPHALMVFWGPEHVLFYNDASRPMMGKKHPATLGQPALEIWPEVRALLGPMLDDVLRTGRSVLQKDALVPTARNGYLQELYFSWSYSPLRIESGAVGAVFQVATETTDEVLAARRQDVLWRLALTPISSSAEAACAASVQQLSSQDLPFALVYLLESTGARLAAVHGLAAGGAQSPQFIELGDPDGAWPLGEVARTGAPVEVDGLEARFGVQTVAGWQVAPHRAWVLPLTQLGDQQSLGFLVAGLSAGGELDDAYVGFLKQVAGRIAGAASAARDLVARAERARMVEVLRGIDDARREDLHRLFEKVPVAMSLLRGPEHRYELANEAHHALVGRQIALGQSAREAFPELPSTFNLALDRVFQTGETLRYVEEPISLRQPNGTVRETFVTFTLAPFLNAVGAPDGVVMVGQDATETVLARRRIESIAEELRLADRRKDDFLAMLAHELRNPLSALGLALHLIELRPATDEKELRARGVARRQTFNLGRLVDDLLDVSRITRGKVELRIAPVDFVTVVQAALQAVRGAFEAKNHTSSVGVGPGRFIVQGDAVRLEQVLTNLLVNASKYTPPGGQVSLRLRREERSDASWAVLEVTDNGEGIAPEILTRIFEVFVQADTSIGHSQGGLGIGLTVARSLVTLHGGQLTASSEGPGRGSTFSLSLPLSAGAAATKATELALTPSAAPAPLRIVLVEDNDDGREVVGQLLEEMGHTVRMFADGRQGRDAIIVDPPDVAFIDIGLPLLDGYQVAEQVVAAQIRVPPYLVAMTGYGDSEAQKRTRQSGFDEHLTKPVSREQIDGALTSAQIRRDRSVRREHPDRNQ